MLSSPLSRAPSVEALSRRMHRYARSCSRRSTPGPHFTGAAIGLGEVEPRDRRGRRADGARRRRRETAQLARMLHGATVAAGTSVATSCPPRRRHFQRARGDVERRHRGVIPWDLVGGRSGVLVGGQLAPLIASRGLIDDEAIETGTTVLFAVVGLRFGEGRGGCDFCRQRRSGSADARRARPRPISRQVGDQAHVTAGHDSSRLAVRANRVSNADEHRPRERTSGSASS